MDYDTVYPTSNTPATFSPNGPPAALPDNVLRRIFDLYIQGPLVFPPPTDEHRWVLTRVCAKWRFVVVSTPSYWTAYDLSNKRFNTQTTSFIWQKAFLYGLGTPCQSRRATSGHSLDPATFTSYSCRPLMLR
jgi:hypothetical protein